MIGWCIGIDLGGTRIEGILLDGTGRQQARLRLPTPAGGAGAAIAAVADLVNQLERESPFAARPLPRGAAWLCRAA